MMGPNRPGGGAATQREAHPAVAVSVQLEKASSASPPHTRRAIHRPRIPFRIPQQPRRRSSLHLDTSLRTSRTPRRRRTLATTVVLPVPGALVNARDMLARECGTVCLFQDCDSKKRDNTIRRDAYHDRLNDQKSRR